MKRCGAGMLCIEDLPTSKPWREVVYTIYEKGPTARSRQRLWGSFRPRGKDGPISFVDVIAKPTVLELDTGERWLCSVVDAEGHATDRGGMSGSATPRTRLE